MYIQPLRPKIINSKTNNKSEEKIKTFTRRCTLSVDIVSVFTIFCQYIYDLSQKKILNSLFDLIPINKSISTLIHSTITFSEFKNHIKNIFYKKKCRNRMAAGILNSFKNSHFFTYSFLEISETWKKLFSIFIL